MAGVIVFAVGFARLRCSYATKKKECVLENGGAYVTDEVIDVQTWFDDATGDVGIAVDKNGAGACRFGASDILGEPVKSRSVSVSTMPSS